MWKYESSHKLISRKIRKTEKLLHFQPVGVGFILYVQNQSFVQFYYQTFLETRQIVVISWIHRNESYLALKWE